MFGVIPATEVAKKWNVTGLRLNEIVKKYRLPVYKICEKRVRPTDGKTIYFCYGPSFGFYSPYDDGDYQLDDEYFNITDIELYEVEHPEILWTPAYQEESLEKEYGENIPADVIRRHLKMSPIQFINLMNSGEGPACSWEEDFINYDQFRNGPYFKTSDLKSEYFTFHILDWLSWQKARSGEDKAKDANEDVRREKDAPIAELEADNEHLKARITELETEFAACRKQLEEARGADSSGKEGHELPHSEDFPAEYEGHGIFTMVAKLVDARAPVVDIIRLLNNEKDFLSQKENGYFFHPKPEGKSASTLRNYIKNRVKKE